MKNCTTLKGLLKAIANGEECRLKYESIAPTTDGGRIIYCTNGTNLIISNRTYAQIQNNLIRRVC
jgi:hypothetical protein